MASSYGSMTLRERASEDKNKQKGSTEKSQDSSDGSVSTRLRKQEQPPPVEKKKGDFRGAKYDSHGIHKETQKDLCDCLTIDCPGCFMPCPKCSSKKCGHECRCNRRWVYESFEIEGTSLVVKKQTTK